MDLLPIPLISGGAQMSNMPEDTYNRLFQLIQSSENKELECREFLQYAKTNLVTETVSKFVYVEKELDQSLEIANQILKKYEEENPDL